jgi:hypothetical protein
VAKNKTNKSEAIRQELATHPEKSAIDIAKALKVKPALVYNVKASVKAKARRPERTRQKSAVSAESTNASVQQVIAAARLIKVCGGIDAAKQALKAAEQVAAALET